jgi:1-deoxy-D-xylulose-5-phosphate reductoisomerase
MRTPIQYALTWPHRAAGCATAMDWASLSRLVFEPIDHDRFGAVQLAYRAIEAGGTAGAILNAANEAAVSAFLHGRIGFARITELVAEALETIEVTPAGSLEQVLEADAEARRCVQRRCGRAAASDVAAGPG